MGSRIADRLPQNKARETRVLRIAIVASPAALIAGAVGLPWLRIVLPIGTLALWVLVLAYVRRLPRLLLSGLIGGGVAGLVALGAGSRLAMRLVSLLGARREMTIEGTSFLLLMGLIFGAMVGVSIAAALRAWPGARRTIGTIVGLALFAGITLDSVAFNELMHDGAGGWVNFPLFLAFPMAYGWAATRLIERVERRVPRWTPLQHRAEASTSR
jgi:hypothetical protein